MKLAMIGSYGHCGYVLNAIEAAQVELAAVAKWGPDDPLSYLGTHAQVPATTPVYDDYIKMLEEVRPDVVGVFTPLYQLAQASIASLTAGAHVISEKPLATTLADLAKLREAIDASDRQIIAALAMRCEPAFQAARQAVHEGRIGEPLLASGQKSYPFANRDSYYKNRETYGGSMLWQAIHAVDFISYVCGRDYARVAATAGNQAHPTHPGMEDVGTAIFDFVGGGHACVWFDYLRPWGRAERPWGDDRLRVAGSLGVVEVVDCGARAVLTTPDEVTDLPLPARRDLFAEFVASLEGRGESIITPAESLRITEVCLKARDAQDRGQVVEL